MAKNVYRIPASLNRSFLDHEIVLSGGGFQMKPLPMKVILFWVGSIFVLFWMITSTFIKEATWWVIVLLVIWWFVATAFFGSYSKAKEMKFTSVPALMNYTGSKNRHVVTRNSADPSAFYSVTQLDDVDKDGIITWADGTVGRAYLVVGSASVLVFAEDKVSILERVQAFWQKVDTTCEFLWITTKEPQRVWRQMANLDARNIALTARDPELLELMDEQYHILKDYVGGSFNSIHQYLVVKADNPEALRKAHVVVRSEAAESSLMIKQLTILDKADAQEMLSSVYQTDQIAA